MRQKVLDYLEKPSAKLKKELTTMEQKWVDSQKVNSPDTPPKKK